ncbi:MAG: PIN domain-containing protein [Chloroflexi bacterium]|nr:PIN domain-containing protein [Chloroflexota bacterium]
MLYCFLDTNIFLEFKQIKDIKWLIALGTAEVCLVVTSVVLRELDKHKTGNSNRLRRRARNTISFFKSLDRRADNEIRPNVTLRFDLTEPKRLTLEKHNLSADVNDDLLIAKALEFRSLQDSEGVAIVTDDTVVQFKAEGYGLDVPVLSEKNRLPHEINPLEQENRELKNELLKLQHSQPKLQLGFRDSDGNLVTFLHASNDFSQSLISKAELDALIELKCINLPPMREERPITNDRLLASPVSALTAKVVTSSQIEEYNRKLEEYPKHLREFLLEKSLANVFPHRSVRLNLVLINEGSVPAQNVEIRLNHQDTFKVLPQVPEVPPYEPSPPAKPEPRSRFDFDSSLTGSLAALTYGIHGNDIDLGPLWEEWTRETDNSGSVWYEYGIAKLQHHRSQDIETLHLMFGEHDDYPITATVDYEVTADNMVEILTGSLTVVVKKEPP